MKRNLMYSLLALALTWTACEYATQLNIVNNMPYPITLWTDNSQCGQHSRGHYRKEVAPGQTYSICAFWAVSSELIAPSDSVRGSNEFPIFSQQGNTAFSYKVDVPAGQIWTVNVISLSSANGLQNIAGDGYITEAVLNSMNKSARTKPKSAFGL